MSHRVSFTLSNGSTEDYVSSSDVLRATAYDDPSKPYEVSGSPRESYGEPSARTVIRIGNGGIGPTGLLQELCQQYLAEKELQDTVRFEWICNPSRLTQVALEAGKIDLALTYERDNEAIAAKERWSKIVGVLCHDHWVLVGPSSDPAQLRDIYDPKEALRSIAQHGSTFHTRGDGSATMHMEHDLWTAAGIPLSERDKTKWYQRIVGSPLSALREADAQGAYMFVDRATCLFARTQGWARNSSVWIERQPELLNTCVMCIKPDEQRHEVLEFVYWLKGETAQKTIATFGTDKIENGPWFTPIVQEEVGAKDALRPTKKTNS